MVTKEFDLSSDADLLERVFRRAKAGGAQLAVAPEWVLEGYVVNRIIDGEVPTEKIKSVAVTIDDKLIRWFQSLTCELEMCLAAQHPACLHN